MGVDMRCTAVESGIRCSMNVKDGNPGVYSFCTEFRTFESMGRMILKLRPRNQIYVPLPVARTHEYDGTARTSSSATTTAAITETAATPKDQGHSAGHTPVMILTAPLSCQAASSAIRYASASDTGGV